MFVPSFHFLDCLRFTFEAEHLYEEKRMTRIQRGNLVCLVTIQL